MDCSFPWINMIQGKEQGAKLGKRGGCQGASAEDHCIPDIHLQQPDVASLDSPVSHNQLDLFPLLPPHE